MGDTPFYFADHTGYVVTILSPEQANARIASWHFSFRHDRGARGADTRSKAVGDFADGQNAWHAISEHGRTESNGGANGR